MTFGVLISFRNHVKNISLKYSIIPWKMYVFFFLGIEAIVNRGLKERRHSMGEGKDNL